MANDDLSKKALKTIYLEPLEFCVKQRIGEVELYTCLDPQRVAFDAYKSMTLAIRAKIWGKKQVYEEKVPLNWFWHLWMTIMPLWVLKRIPTKTRTIRVEAATLAPDFIAPKSMGQFVKVILNEPPVWVK